jgi:hypothetical protein
VSEGKGPDCTTEAKAEEETKPSQEADAAPDSKPAKPLKSRSARTRPMPSFLRRVDLFLSHRR